MKNKLHNIDIKNPLLKAYFDGFSAGYMKAIKDDSYSFYIKNQSDFIKYKFYEHLSELSEKE